MIFWTLAIAFPLIFISTWCVVFTLLARLGGWSQLARHFGAERQPQGKAFRLQSGKVGWVNYNNCWTIILTPNALYLAMPWIFGFQHPPLLIPWSELHNLSEKKIMFRSFAVADVGNPVTARLTLPLSVLQQKPE